MNSVRDHAIRILNQSILVNVYSSPNFIMDISVGLLMIFVHFLLITEISNMIRQLNTPPLKIRPRNSVTILSSSEKPVLTKHPDFGVNVIFKHNSMISTEWDTLSKINAILSTSITDFIYGSCNKNKKEKAEEPVELIQAPIERLHEPLRYKI